MDVYDSALCRSGVKAQRRAFDEGFVRDAVVCWRSCRDVDGDAETDGSLTTVCWRR